MKKDIKDYLHLYLGCDFESKSNPGAGVFKLSPIDLLEHMIDDVSLILRPLLSITDDERKELWRLVFSMGNGIQFTDRFKDFTGYVHFIDEKTYYDVPRYIMMQGVERLCIESDGTVWADCDLNNWRHNQHEVTRWFLSKGFDLFGLIEDGLAIEKKNNIGKHSF